MDPEGNYREQMTTVHDDLGSAGQRRGVTLLPVIVGLVVGAASCSPTNQHDDSSRSEYDEKWLAGDYGHVGGKVNLAPDKRDAFVELLDAFGRKHRFDVIIDRDRPGPRNRIPFVLMKRSDGTDISGSDFMDGQRAFFSLRQPAPQDDWKPIAITLVGELVSTFGDSVRLDVGVWLPVDEGFVAALWGASRQLNLESESMFQVSAQSVPDLLVHETLCVNRPCRLSFHFAEDQLYRVSLVFPRLASGDYQTVAETTKATLISYFGAPISETKPNVPVVGSNGSDSRPERRVPEAESKQWRVGFTQVDAKWERVEDHATYLLVYTDLDLLPQQPENAR